ncbi:receptor-transporting protein 3-like isoform X2 [Notolabrus celidotus]|nr:receptor-transporting protein 3-like isoform X2 [Notolabrus celidotus]XP_034534703.1 receptor-transporting protein 3-like isoform X2 [Notolabrus celidotus]XP_034534704.1 receptor-transporting protein 3-like isoform X2 [Notolabrus celidotus]XP_034534706.1 receptor-transporting protein 3-like isoform X2 [Notolabrus celidotus]
MAELDQTWIDIFESKTSDLREGDSWCLEFDKSLDPERPDPGWQKYIRNTSARFRCSKCGRTWPSNQVKVVFHMQLREGRGVVKVRCFRQNCKKCHGAPMEKPQIDSENIDILLENLVKKIRIKCYHEDMGPSERRFEHVEVNNPHEPSHCEACLMGICKQGM